MALRLLLELLDLARVSHPVEGAGRSERLVTLDSDGVRCDLGGPREQRPELPAVKHFEPLLMGAFLVAALPLEIGLVEEVTLK